MRGKVLIALMVGMVVNFFALTAFAQEEKPKGQLWLIEECAVKPCGVGEFEAVVKEFVAQAVEHKYPYRWYGHSSNDFRYYFAYPVENLGAVDNIFEAGEELAEKMGKEQYQALHKRFEGNIEYVKFLTFRFMPERSYTPENPRLLPEERKFEHVNYIYLPYGKGKEFEEVGKEWVALYKSKNISDGYEFYRGVIGTDNPWYMLIRRAKNRADYYSQSEVIDELLGEEGTALWKKTMPLFKKIERLDGWERPDLSYTPQKEE